MIITFQVQPDVFIHIDRSQLRKHTSENLLETLAVDDEVAKAGFTTFWVQCWLQDYSNHQAVGSTRVFSSLGWMPMQLRGLRDSFAQILTDTRKILFAD